MSSPVAAIRRRMSATDRRLRKIRRLQRALERLQAERRRELAAQRRPTVMFDSIDVATIPSDAPAVAGYVNGHWPTFTALVHRFPGAHRLSIAVTASADADCLDVEPGDATTAQAADWLRRQLTRGVHRPVVYHSLSGLQQLVDELARHGIPRQAYRIWSAHYTGHPHVCTPSSCPGFGLRVYADATQYTDRALGRNLDESICNAEFWT